MIFPVVPFICFVLFCHLARRYGADRSVALLVGAVCWGVTVTALTEILSSLHGLTFWGVLTGWLAILCILVAAARNAGGSARRLLRYAWERFLGLSFSDRWQLCAAASLLGVAAFAGLFSAPSNLDSMTYHLTRVMHWVQNRSLEYYPTAFTPQLYQPPWAELAMLNLQLLSGDDRLAFAVQWASFALCLVGVWSIAGRLGADGRGQVLAVVFVATAPEALLQASSTQNNLALALWLICFARLLLDYRVADGTNRLLLALGCGAAIGLAMLTKGTAYPLAAPLVIWFAVVTLRRRSRRSSEAAVAAIAVAVLLNAAHWSQNYQAFNSPLTPPSELVLYRADFMSPTLLISNLSRNLALDVSTPSLQINRAIERIIDAEHHLLGVDINDPRITASLAAFSILTYPRFSEDSTGNPLHLLLFICACVWTGLAAARH